MSDGKSILLAFLIPFGLAVVLTLLGYFVFAPACSVADPGQSVCFEYRDSWLLEEEYRLFVLGLFFLSLILPPFVMLRTYQNRRRGFNTLNKWK